MGPDKSQSVLERWRQRDPGKKKSQETALSKPMCTPAQKRLWFLQEVFQGNPFYHVAELGIVTGNLDKKLFQSAVQTVCDQHDVFKTLFDDADGTVRPIVTNDTKVEFLTVDLESDSVEEIESEARIAARKPFDLRQGPLARIVFLESTRIEAVLVVVHHIIFDMRSMQIFFEEISSCYRNPKTEKLKKGAQFLDVVAQTDFHRAPDSNPGVSLDEYPKTLDLPLDSPRPAIPSFEGALYFEDIGEELSHRVLAAAQSQGLTPFVFLLSVYCCVLASQSGQQKLLVGVPLTSRRTIESEQVIGFFDETVVIGADFEKYDQFSSFATDIGKQINNAFESGEQTLDSLIELINPDRSLSINPLLQSMFIYQKGELRLDLGNVEIEFSPFDSGVSKFDLTLYISEVSGILEGIFEYATDILQPDSINRISQQFRLFTERSTANPDVNLKDLMVPGVEETALIRSFEKGQPFEVPETSVVERIIKQSKTFPEKTAIADAFETVSYSRLINEAGKIAARIEAEGFGGKPIGIVVRRDWKTIAAIIGILGAGSAYVPIGSNEASDRRDSALDSIGVELVLGTDADRLTEFSFIDLAEIETSDFDFRSIDMSTDAYIIRTSGSTGKPKNVAVSHRNLALSNLSRQWFYEESPDGFLLVSPLTFDSSVAGLFWTLSTGGTLVIPGEISDMDADSLSRLISENKVTHSLMLPSLVTELVTFVSEGCFSDLKTLLVAGEPLKETARDTIFESLPDVRLFNEYGPTETTVWCSVAEILKDAETISIGNPIPGYRIYILDEQQRRVPFGTVGELYVGGEGVARYLGSEETRFFTDIDDPSKTMYRTGDLCRYLKDGNIEFKGRVDFQIKRRGYRIELAEVDAALESVDSVRKSISVVMRRSDLHLSQGKQLERIVSRTKPELIERLLDELEELNQ